MTRPDLGRTRSLVRTSAAVRALLACLAWSALACASGAGDAPDPGPTTFPRHVLANTQLRSLPRSANGRDYLLYVALPYSYDTSPGRRYPVLYVCDGYWDFTLLNGFYGNLVWDKSVPEFIIVGLGYQGEKPDFDALRRYDYTPAPAPDDPKGERSGHAAEFLKVLEGQVLPFVEKEYRADPGYRVLGGSSLGGLFALYAMYAKPGLFRAYIAPSPAVDWASDWLFGFEADFAATKGRPLDARLFMSGAGAEWPGFLKGIQRFHARLERRAYKGLAYEWRLVEGERHAGTKAESYNRGVRFAFAPLAPEP
jgi:predicted alpha/beta superfamily hydrolase